VDAGVVAKVQGTLNTFRARLGVAPADARPRQFPALVDDAFAVIIEERVPVWSIGLGNPEPTLVDRCHAAGILVMTMVTNVEDARAAAATGVDIVVAQGAEAGGHRSMWRRGDDGQRPGIATLVLVPQVVDAIRQPVLAAGGIADGRGLAAALAL